MTTASLKFRGRRYNHERSIPTQLSTAYVPDWDLFHALRESLQNAYDEATLTGAKVSTKAELDEDGLRQRVWIRDTGRGVPFESIFLLGVSGKRGLSNVIGEHGEGEIVSSLVAARLGVVKTLASQDWLARGRLVEEGSHSVLMIDLYRSRTPRKGTCWCYELPDFSSSYDLAYELRQAKDVFRVAVQSRRRKKRGRVFACNAGQLYTNGLEVNSMWGLSNSYNLSQTPGRDRRAFTWGMVRDEIQDILEADGKPEHFARILQRALDYGPGSIREMELNPLVSPKIARRAAYLATGRRGKYSVSWAMENRDEALVADAREQGYSVLVFNGSPPEWIRTFPHVRFTCNGKVNGKRARELPVNMVRVIEPLLNAFPEGLLPPVQFRLISRFEDGAYAAAGGGTITFSRAYLKDTELYALAGTVAHEYAHIITREGDCTRTHESKVQSLLSKLAMNLAESVEARAAWEQARKRLKVYKRI